MISIRPTLESMNRRLLAAPAALTLLALTACGSGDGGSSTGGAASQGGKDGKLGVVASFYPLQHAAEQIGGQHVQVTNLTKPGSEPHDLELTPKDVATLSQADLAIYEKGLQSAVDTAVADTKPDKALDVATAANLSLTHGETIGEDGHDHATESAEEHAGHSHGKGAKDPHFWLDPQRYAKVSQAIADRLKQADPAHAADYDANLKAFTGRLTALDSELAAGLKGCTNTTIVTSHAAFGYLADRYGLQQVAISGLSPEEEPEPAKLAEIAKYAKSHKVTTIYAETLVSPAIAQTVAKETGAQTAVLDPIEGITDSSAAKDYVGVMKANLATLKKGQSCP